MKVNGSKIKDRVRVNNATKTVLFIQAGGTTMSQTDLENKSTKTETSTTETLQTARLTVKENIYGLMSLNMQVSGIRINKMDRARRPGLMGLITRVAMCKVRRPARGSLSFRMAQNIQAILRIINWMVMEFIRGKIGSIQAIGKITK